MRLARNRFAADGLYTRFQVEAAMTWHRDSESPHSFQWPPGWLPPYGRGNGLAARAWTQLVDVDEPLVDPLLHALLVMEIPAHAAPRSTALRRHVRHGNRAWRVWVEVWSHAHAEEVVRNEILRLRRETM